MRNQNLKKEEGAVSDAGVSMADTLFAPGVRLMAPETVTDVGRRVKRAQAAGDGRRRRRLTATAPIVRRRFISTHGWRRSERSVWRTSIMSTPSSP